MLAITGSGLFSAVSYRANNRKLLVELRRTQFYTDAVLIEVHKLLVPTGTANLYLKILVVWKR